MRWGRATFVATVLALPVCVAPLRQASAAPMTGVAFTDVTRIVDVTPLDAGTHHFTINSVVQPAMATQALIEIGVTGSETSAAGVVMVHDCGTAPDPARDVVLPIRPGPPLTAPMVGDWGQRFVTNEVVAPVTGGVLCVTTTAHVFALQVDLYGWVGSGESVYVDTPFVHADTIVGPSAAKVVNLSELGVPPNATGVAVWLGVSSPTNGSATIYPCGQADLSSVPQANWFGGVPTRALVAGISTGSAGLCILTPVEATIEVSLDGYYAPGVSATSTSAPQLRYTEQQPPRFVSTPPTRLFDTRDAGTPIGAGDVYRLDVSPFVSADATAVVMNVTATQTGAAGFVTAFPCDGQQPDTSSLNFVAGQTVPNLVTVDAGLDLTVCFFASASTHLLADLAGYYVFDGRQGDGFAPSSPVRMFDTRATSKIAAGTVFEFDASPFVAADASSIVFNLTATDVDGPGFITAYPCGQAPPKASNLNVLPGQTVPNLVTVALPSNRHVCFFSAPGANLLADLAGSYSPSAASGFFSILPTRWGDTRDLSDEPLPADSIFFVRFDEDFPDATAIAFNLTVTEPTAAGYLTAFPCNAADLPNASNVNFVAGQTVPNMGISVIDPAGRLCVYNSAATQWIVDVDGFFTDQTQFLPFFPPGTDNL